MIRKIVLFLVIVALCCKPLFAVNIATVGLDSSLMNTYLAEDESGNTDIKKVVNDFVSNYIRYDMTDFEKEIQIIKYLVENVTYDIEELEFETLYVSDTYKAYGALVNHKAVCSGYAKAFDLLAKSCGLSSIVVTGEAINSTSFSGPHAWNQIYLDGEWYNVDVTWEDPITNVKLGFDNLLNEYINRTDFEISKNHVRETGNVCTATKYGKNAVAYYLHTGVVDLNGDLDILRRSMLMQVYELITQGKNDEADKVVEKLCYLGAKFDDNSNFVAVPNDMEVNDYILRNLANDNKIISIVTPSDSKGKLAIDSGHWMKDNLNINKKVELKSYFVSGGNEDVRILVFIY